ncbi:MAG: hypothetical protein K2M06_07275 [Muribaculaceae bacterium]|nr:hypothetical protein [Muribaculaceae bacterium]
MIKKNLLIGVLAASMGILGSCSDKKDQQLKEAQELNNATREQLATAVADRDQLLQLMNDISDDMQKIKQIEGVMANPGVQETPDRQAQLRNDFQALQQTLQERRDRLAELEKKLNDSNITSSNLKKTIQTLRQQIDDQAAEIAQLRTSLGEAKARIGQLDAEVDSLNVTVSEVTAARDEAREANTNLTNELNLCYYAIGSNGELKDHKILEGGFLRKTKIMKGDFDQNFFTAADKRTLTTIDLNSKKAEVMTNQPADSYVIEERAGRKVLRITDPAKFWSLSNYLVVKID